MSALSDQRAENKAITKEDLEEWLKKRLEVLRSETKMIETLLSYIQENGVQNVNEKSEEVKFGRRRIGRILRGETYIRLIPETPIPLPSELREYLETVEGELKSSQLKEGLDESGQAKLVIKERPDASIAEIRFEGLNTTIEMLKAKAALKYTAEIAYQIYKAQNRQSDETIEK